MHSGILYNDVHRIMDQASRYKQPLGIICNVTWHGTGPLNNAGDMGVESGTLRASKFPLPRPRVGGPPPAGGELAVAIITRCHNVLDAVVPELAWVSQTCM